MILRLNSFVPRLCTQLLDDNKIDYLSRKIITTFIHKHLIGSQSDNFYVANEKKIAIIALIIVLTVYAQCDSCFVFFAFFHCTIVNDTSVTCSVVLFRWCNGQYTGRLMVL
jgi:hypothetical protein